MHIASAYLTIILVWSTTPIAIAWSGSTMSPIAALSLRMLLAAIVGWVLLRILSIKLSWESKARRTYAYSQLGIVGAMTCVYSAAQMVPSALISVLFALSPIFSSLWARYILSEQNMTFERFVAFLVSFAGLCFIFADRLFAGAEAWAGIVLLVLGVNLYSYSGVKVQQLAYRGNPLAITVGSVLVSVPLFLIVWLLMDGTLPDIDWHSRAPYAVLYLALFGSLLGFCAYFFLLKHVGAAAVAMTTLITPALALMLGAVFNNEVVTPAVYLGTGFILSGLFLFYRDTLFSRKSVNKSVNKSVAH